MNPYIKVGPPPLKRAVGLAKKTASHVHITVTVSEFSRIIWFRLTRRGKPQHGQEPKVAIEALSLALLSHVLLISPSETLNTSAINIGGLYNL